MIKQVEYNGFTFTNASANLSNFAGAGLPDIRQSEAEKSQQDGTIATGYKYGGRTFGWSGTLITASFSEYKAQRRALMLALSMQNMTDVAGWPMTLTLLDDTTLTLRAVRVTGQVFDFPEGEMSRQWNSYQVTFRAAFPFFEGDETVSTQGVTESSGGTIVGSPVGSPMRGTVYTSSPSDAAVLTNAGNANAYPTIKISGAGTSFTVSNFTTGHSMTIDYTLADGEFIEIDTWNETVISNSGDEIEGDLDGSFIYLKPGNNTIAFDVAGDDAATSLEITYKDTYLNI